MLVNSVKTLRAFHAFSLLLSSIFSYHSIYRCSTRPLENFVQYSFIPAIPYLHSKQCFSDLHLPSFQIILILESLFVNFIFLLHWFQESLLVIIYLHFYLFWLKFIFSLFYCSIVRDYILLHCIDISFSKYILFYFVFYLCLILLWFKILSFKQTSFLLNISLQLFVCRLHSHHFGLVLHLLTLIYLLLIIVLTWFDFDTLCFSFLCHIFYFTVALNDLALLHMSTFLHPSSICSSSSSLLFAVQVSYSSTILLFSI